MFFAAKHSDGLWYRVFIQDIVSQNPVMVRFVSTSDRLIFNSIDFHENFPRVHVAGIGLFHRLWRLRHSLKFFCSASETGIAKSALHGRQSKIARYVPPIYFHDTRIGY